MLRQTNTEMSMEFNVSLFELLQNEMTEKKLDLAADLIARVHGQFQPARS